MSTITITKSQLQELLKSTGKITKSKLIKILAKNKKRKPRKRIVRKYVRKNIPILPSLPTANSYSAPNIASANSVSATLAKAVRDNEIINYGKDKKEDKDITKILTLLEAKKDD